MVVAVATLAFSVGINSTANAAEILINDYDGLMAINRHIEDGDDIDNEYFLTSNIELPSIEIAPEEFFTYINGVFRGSFDGQGHTIYNLAAPLFDVIGEAKYYARESVPVLDENGDPVLDENGNVVLETIIEIDDQGIQVETSPGNWSWIPDSSAPGSIRNLGLKTGEAGIIGDANNGYVGVLAGELSAISMVDRVGVSGSISTNAEDIAGGLVGYAGYGTTISNSHSLVSIDTAGVGQSSAIAGGLVGQLNYGTITNSTSTGSVSTTSGYAAVGGLVGLSDNGYIANSSASGDVTVSGNEDQLFQGAAGGLVGALTGNLAGVYNSSASGVVTTTGNSTNAIPGFGTGATGGLVGVAGYGASVMNSSASGDVHSQSSFTGGLVGYADGGSISGNSAFGDVTVEIGETFYSPEIDPQIDPPLPLVELVIESVGGLVGYSSSEIAYNSASGDVAVSSSALSGADIRFVGGLVGEGKGVYQSIANGDVYVEGLNSSITGVGGLAGVAWEVIGKSEALGDVHTIADNGSGIGGLVGISGVDIYSGNIYDSVAEGNVVHEGSDSYDVGGLVGSGKGIYNSIAYGDVTALSAENVGGLAGSAVYLVNTAADGVTTGMENVGLLAGLVGKRDANGAPVLDMNENVIGGIYDSVYLGDLAEQVLAGHVGFITDNVSTYSLGVMNPQGLSNNVVVGLSYTPGPTEPPMYEGAELLNYNFPEPSDAWDEDPAVISGRPYIQALLEFGFYTDDFYVNKTPKPTAAAIAFVQSNPKFTQADSTILRLFLYLAGDESIRITIKDFEVLGATGVNEKNLPVLLKLLKKVDLSTLDLSTIKKNIKMADELLKKQKKK